MERIETVCVLGLGYVGLPTASVLATRGFKVLGVDLRPEVVETINRGEIHIEEPGLATVVAAAVKSGNLKASLRPAPSDAFLIAVPTPITKDKRADMDSVRSAAESLVPHLRPGALVILESTSPPRTTTDILCPILSRSGLTPGKDLLVCYCPERILPGNTLGELIGNDRVVGGLTPQSAARARELYARFVQGTIHLTDCTTAEMVKLMENTSRDVAIALANEFADLCETFGTDVREAVRLANCHPRVRILSPGPGVGGHCIPVDPWFLVEAAPGVARLIRTAREINDARPAHVLSILEQAMSLRGGVRVAVLGVSYKADTDDARESPSEVLCEELSRRGVPFAATDPHVRKFHYPLEKIESALKGADAAILMVDHAEYQALAPDPFLRHMRGRVVLDTRGVLDPEAFRSAGLDLRLLGRGTPQKRD